MSDINIPGFSNQNSTIDTEQVIADLLELERVPVDRLETKIDQYQLERQAWFGLGRRVTQLAENASFLFSFQNPFNDRIGLSSNERAIRVTPTRGADEGVYSMEIIQNAGRDRFQSNPIKDDYQVPPGTYVFGVGEEDVTIDFTGGSLQSFSEEINSADSSILTTRVVRTARDTNTFIVQAQKYGKDNRLSFKEDALLFAEQQGIIARKKIERFQDNNEYTIATQSERRIPLAEQITPDASSILSFTAIVDDFSPEEHAAIDFQLSSSGSVTRENVTVPNIRSEILLSEPEPITIDNSHRTVVYAELSDNTEIPVANIETSDQAQSIAVSLENIPNSINALVLRNDNTHQTITVSDINIGADSPSNYEPLNVVEQARDAILKIDDIEVRRSSNIIDDLIPRTTVELLAEQSPKLEIEVTPDYENIKNSIIRFVGSYNQLIRELNILTRQSPEIIEELEFLTDEERSEAQERLGLMQGSITLSQLRSKLINFTQNPYPTSAGQEVNLLSQIGIATNVGGFNSGINRTRLRGYLELDETQLDQALQEHFQAVRELFGNDTNSDLAIDSGVAYEIDRHSNLFTQSGGVIQIRTEGIDNSINQSNEQLVNHEERIENYEEKLRSEFGRMQNALNSLDSATQSLERLQTQ